MYRVFLELVGTAAWLAVVGGIMWSWAATSDGKMSGLGLALIAFVVALAVNKEHKQFEHR